MSLAVIFGTNLRNCRKAKRLTQADLAEKVALSTEMISKIERGVASPSFGTVEKIAEVLDVSEGFLFGNNLLIESNDDRNQVLLSIQSKLSRLNSKQLLRIDRIILALID